MPIHGVPVPRVSTETLALMAEGYSNADIAAMLVPTEATHHPSFAC
jgi:hypothetical protein